MKFGLIPTRDDRTHSLAPKQKSVLVSSPPKGFFHSAGFCTLSLKRNTNRAVWSKLVMCIPLTGRSLRPFSSRDISFQSEEEHESQ